MLKPTVSDQRIVLYLLYKENAKVTDMIKGLVVAHVIRIVISKLNLMTVSHEKGNLLTYIFIKLIYNHYVFLTICRPSDDQRRRS